MSNMTFSGSIASKITYLKRKPTKDCLMFVILVNFVFNAFVDGSSYVSYVHTMLNLWKVSSLPCRGLIFKTLYLSIWRECFFGDKFFINLTVYMLQFSRLCKTPNWHFCFFLMKNLVGIHRNVAQKSLIIIQTRLRIHMKFDR